MNFQTVLEELDRLYEDVGGQLAGMAVGGLIGGPAGAVAGGLAGHALTEEDDDVEESFGGAVTGAIAGSAVAGVPGAIAGGIVGHKLSEAGNEEAVERQLLLECANCGAIIIKGEGEADIDEESGLANAEEACQYCEEAAGYKIIGVVAPYDVAEDEDLEEGIFDSKATKQKNYEKAIGDAFGKASAAVAPAVASKAIQVLSEMSSWDGDEIAAKNHAKDMIRRLKSAMVSVNKTPQALLRGILELGNKNCPNSNALDDVKDFFVKLKTLTNTPKVGVKATAYLMEKVNKQLAVKTEQTIKFLKKEYSIVEELETEADVEELEEPLDIDLPISANVNVNADGNNVSVGSLG